MNVNIGSRSRAGNLLDTIVVVLLMLFIEPALLSLFGTTAGKWILGLRVTDSDYCRLSYYQALSRTGTVFLRGMGLDIPIYNIVRHWKSYKACEAGETLDWEYDSTITLQDEKGWRIGAYIGAYALVFAVLFLAVSMAEMPKHRGEITVAEFCENYNRLADYHGSDTVSYLDESGKWTKKENAGYVINIGGAEKPEYIFTEENGVMTGLKFSTQLHNSDVWPPSYRDEMILSVLSFVSAQKGCGPFSGVIKDVVEKISQSPFEDLYFTAYGVSITCSVEYSGYRDMSSSGLLWPEDGTETEYSFSFEMLLE